MADNLASALISSSRRLGIDPTVLGTVMSYETGGTLNPAQRGPTTQWGQHIGLIQMGEPQRARFGYDPSGDLDGQMRAVERYLVNAGVRPGMGLLDVYSAVNAGRVGRYNASDANNGGAPGTVADKVNNQMAGHRQKAVALLAGQMRMAGMTAAPQPAAPAPAPAAAPGTPAMNAADLAGLFEPTPAPVDQGLGGIVAMAAQRTTARQAERQAQEEADRARRAALLSGVGAMFA